VATAISSRSVLAPEPWDRVRIAAMTRSFVLVSLVSLVAIISGCASAGDELDDAEADASELSVTAADKASLSGVYRWADASKPYWNNDIPSLDLAATRYVRSRCYGWDCEHLVAQTGAVRWVKSSTNKIYLRFMSFEKQLEGEEWIEHAVVADTFEIKKTASGVALRKTYSSRWIALDASTPAGACDASGGTWSAADATCACPALPAADWSHRIDFVPGLGGCFEIFASNEEGCDETHGAYLDDDASALGTWCLCPVGTYETQAGCAAL
jgi:hypothetical protein